MMPLLSLLMPLFFQIVIDKVQPNSSFTTLNVLGVGITLAILSTGRWNSCATIFCSSPVREAETLITLVPLGGRLEVEAEIEAKDIGKVNEGDPVRVKVSAFPFQKYGTLDGRVRVLSEDAFTRQAENGRAGNTFYRARIELATEGGSLAERIIPGMETQSEIRVGERRIIEYLIHPIIKSLDEAIREP